MKTNKYNGKKTTQTFKFTIKHSTELLKVYIKFFCKCDEQHLSKFRYRKLII